MWQRMASVRQRRQRAAETHGATSLTPVDEHKGKDSANDEGPPVKVRCTLLCCPYSLSITIHFPTYFP